LIPKGRAHIVIGMEPAETLRVMADFGNPNIDVMVSPRPVYPIWVLSGQAEYPPVEDILTRLRALSNRVEVIAAAEAVTAARFANVIMVGALAGSGMLPIAIETFEQAIRTIVPSQAVEMNLAAFRKGMSARC